MPVCVIWLLKTKYFYSILFHFSVPMKNIQHNSNGSWMFFRLNVKWRKWQITRKIWRSHYEIFKNDCCVYALALNRWTTIPGELLWVERDLHGSLLNKHLPLPMNSWFYTGLQTVPASGRDWRCQWGKSGLFMWLCVDVEYAAESSERGITLSWISDVFIDMYKWSKQSAPPKQLFST